jgi:hypothetical protein
LTTFHGVMPRFDLPEQEAQKSSAAREHTFAGGCLDYTK